MRRLLLASLVLMLAAPVVAQDKPSVLFSALGVGGLVVNAIDYQQTMRGTGPEQNALLRPIADSPVALGVVKIGVPLAFNAWTERLRRNGHPRLAWGLRVAMIVGPGAAVIRASRQH